MPSLEEMVKACGGTTWRSTLRTDVAVSSQKYAITGRVHRLFEDGFAIIRGSSAPTNGIYAADRLRLTAYALCLEEEHKNRSPDPSSISIPEPCDSLPPHPSQIAAHFLPHSAVRNLFSTVRFPVPFTAVPVFPAPSTASAKKRCG